MQYIVMDLEWNVGYRTVNKHYFDEIIEIGAVKLDENRNIIGTFSELVRPVINSRLNKTVRKLTNIGYGELKNAENFKFVYQKFANWCGNGDNIVLTWSTMDILVLLRNLRHYGLSEKIEFMCGYIDLQEIVHDKLEKSSNQMLGLAAAAERLGVATQDLEAHRAFDDSLVTAKCLNAVYDNNFHKYMKAADDDFYGRISFKNKILLVYNNPMIKKSSMMIKCPDCGVYMKRTDNWKIMTKAFTSAFECGHCNKKYFGRVKVRLEYDGVRFYTNLRESE